MGATPQSPVMTRNVGGLGAASFFSELPKGSKGLTQESLVVLAEMPRVEPHHPC